MVVCTFWRAPSLAASESSSNTLSTGVIRRPPETDMVSRLGTGEPPPGGTAAAEAAEANEEEEEEGDISAVGEDGSGCGETGGVGDGGSEVVVGDVGL